MDIYTERAHLLKLITAMFGGASIEEHIGEDWDDAWRNVLIIETPEGQWSWHISEADLPLFKHLPYRQGISVWNGHSTEEKYDSISRLADRIVQDRIDIANGVYDI